MINSSRPSDTCMRHSTKYTIGYNDGLPPNQNQTIFDTNTGLLLIEPLEYYRREMRIYTKDFSFNKMYLKRSLNGGHFVSVTMCLIFPLTITLRTKDAIPIPVQKYHCMDRRHVV